MKKIILSFITLLSISSLVNAQSIEDGRKLLNFGKITSAKQVFQKLAASKDPEAIYWLGQTFIENDQLDSAKIIYQNALAAGINDPWIWVGSATVDILQGGDLNAAKQKFEQAITATTATKGKNKGPNPNILNAVGRAMALGGSKVGDPNFGLDKLRQAAAIDPNNADIFINMGLAYRKLGGEQGGQAFEAFRQATVIAPQNPLPFYLIGRIYETQHNQEAMNEWFGKAIAANPEFPPVYLQYFFYYSETDVSVAKEYLDKYVRYADQDCNTDFFVGDYLFRAGKYQESLQKAKEMQAGPCRDFPKLDILFAYNFDRLGDSVQAKTHLQRYFANVSPDYIQPAHFAFAGTVFAKFPETSDSAVVYLKKAVALDTIKENQANYLNMAVEIAIRTRNYAMLTDLINTVQQTTGNKLTETQFFSASKAIVDAVAADATAPFDSTKFLAGAAVIKLYISSYPDRPQPYSFLVRYAKISDRDTTLGLAVQPIITQNEFLLKDTSADAKKSAFANLYYLLIYYAQYAKDLPKEVEYQKAIDVTEQMKAIYTDPASEEYQFADKTGKSIQSNLDKYNKSKAGGASGSTGKSQK